MSSHPDAQTYKAAGVDLDAAVETKKRIKALASKTHGPQVLGGLSGFGGMYHLTGYKDPVLVSGTDGVGTKLKLAIAMKKYETIGQDVVNACVNDVVMTGAKPAYFLDYIALGKMKPEIIEGLVTGIVTACKANGCALVGGETAEMPGMYAEDDFDIAGFAVGVAERSELLDVSTVRPGDILLGVPSSGLHTNGFSLVRHILGLDKDPSPLFEYVPELGRMLGEALLEPHRPYYPVIAPVLKHIKSVAHITGGGLYKNMPRSIPDGVTASFDRGAWPVLPIFTALQERGNVEWSEMYRVFNMGIGLVIVCDRENAASVRSLIPEALVVGEVTRQQGDRRVTLM
ncbi:MAG: phosphoribosylformylglycinamidine cyclo-ligase [SAR202 cluster bacterium]|nr:phosphoribosylformylglycinamidine cyclo-ligase [SAR202 cluster bacterium]